MKSILRFALIAALLSSGGCGSPNSEPGSTKKGTAKPIVVDDSNFEEIVLKSDKPVLVDFWAAWCGPCKEIAPFVEEIAKDYEGRAVIAKLDVDAAGETAQKYNVTSIPTLIVFKGGEEVSRVVGVVGKSTLAAKLDESLK